MEMLYNSHRDVGKRSLLFATAFFTVFVFLTHPVSAGAQADGLTLTIAPPIFQINLQPGETWTSGITVVNNNAYDTTLYAEVVLFEPSGESGTPVFIDTPHTGEGVVATDAFSLAGWVTLPQQGVLIEREQTYTLPFAINVPEGANPGGHYAAILIGNKAPVGVKNSNSLNVTSSIASLIFLTVAGDVDERGKIKDFFTEKAVYEKAEATLSLRFENKGNVHLLPQGNIVIYNMFGKERGTIFVNHQRDYGSVLPDSVRRFTFSWKSDAGLWDIGRYRAEATIAYGKENKQNALATTYFYVIPTVPLLQILGALILVVLFFAWSVKAYIRRALLLERAQLQEAGEESSDMKTVASQTVQQTKTEEHAVQLDMGALMQPIKVGLVDLRRITKAEDKEVLEFKERLSVEQERGSVGMQTFRSFIYSYRHFFMFVVVVACVIFIVSVFVEDVTVAQREYKVEEIRSEY